MPYIATEARERIAQGGAPSTAGELNYAITRLVDEYLAREGVGYRSLNEVVGVLECAKLELYRRIVAPYEDVKMQSAGDVYSTRSP